MRTIIHLDMDAFFASIEQRDRPELRGRPVIVGGRPDQRGVVSTCSYEARRFGVRSAMPTRTALALCPEAELLRPDFRKYRAVSLAIRRILREATDRIEAVSIDEAYLDVTENLLGEPSAEKVARHLQRRILEETGLTASAGVSCNKFLAKVASDFRKPAGITVIPPEAAQEFLAALPIRRFHGIGEVSAARLTAMNVRTGADLMRLPLETLRALFGKAGEFYYHCVRGVDERPVEEPGDPKTISREVTFADDLTDRRRLRITMRTLARQVARRARRHHLAGGSVTLKIKYADFQQITRTAALPRPTDDGETIGEAAVRLAAKSEAGKRPVRLVGVGIGALSDPDAPRPEQLEFDFGGGASLL